MMQDILERLAHSSTTESSHELQCRCFDAAEEISRLRNILGKILCDLPMYECQDFHHVKKDQHKSSECPVYDRFNDAIEQAKKLMPN